MYVYVSMYVCNHSHIHLLEIKQGPSSTAAAAASLASGPPRRRGRDVSAPHGLPRGPRRSEVQIAVMGSSPWPWGAHHGHKGKTSKKVDQKSKFGFRARPRDCHSRIQHQKLCRTHPKSASETSSKAHSWHLLFLVHQVVCVTSFC